MHATGMPECHPHRKKKARLQETEESRAQMVGQFLQMCRQGRSREAGLGLWPVRKSHCSLRPCMDVFCQLSSLT